MTDDARTRVDFFRILVDLKRAGKGFRSIERETSIPKSTLGDIKAGARPRFEDGEALIAYWRKITGGNLQAVPVEPFTRSAAARRIAPA